MKVSGFMKMISGDSAVVTGGTIMSKKKKKDRKNKVKIDKPTHSYGLSNQKMQVDKIQKFVKTTDDWYPNYPGDLVRVFLLNQYNSPNRKWDFVRIAVWGDDDFGLEMDFCGATQEENDAKFKEWKEEIYDKIPDVVTAEYFRKLGFYNA